MVIVVQKIGWFGIDKMFVLWCNKKTVDGMVDVGGRLKNTVWRVFQTIRSKFFVFVSSLDLMK